MALDRSGHYVAFVLCLSYVTIWYTIYKSDYLTGALLFGMAYLFDLRCKLNKIMIENTTKEYSKTTRRSDQSHGL